MTPPEFPPTLVMSGQCRGRPGGVRGKGARVAAFTKRRYPLLSAGRPGVMLAHDAHTTVYLNVARLLAGARRHGVQVGGRERRGPLLRPAARQRREGARGGAADLQGGAV